MKHGEHRMARVEDLIARRRKCFHIPLDSNLVFFLEKIFRSVSYFRLSLCKYTNMCVFISGNRENN